MGLACLGVARDREAMPASLVVFWLPLPYVLSHAEYLVGPRLPMDGVLLCYAAFALVALLPGLGGALRSPRRRTDEDER